MRRPLFTALAALCALSIHLANAAPVTSAGAHSFLAPRGFGAFEGLAGEISSSSHEITHEISELPPSPPAQYKGPATEPITESVIKPATKPTTTRAAGGLKGYHERQAVKYDDKGRYARVTADWHTTDELRYRWKQQAFKSYAKAEWHRLAADKAPTAWYTRFHSASKVKPTNEELGKAAAKYDDKASAERALYDHREAEAAFIYGTGSSHAVDDARVHLRNADYHQGTADALRNLMVKEREGQETKKGRVRQ